MNNLYRTIPRAFPEFYTNIFHKFPVQTFILEDGAMPRRPYPKENDDGQCRKEEDPLRQPDDGPSVQEDLQPRQRAHESHSAEPAERPSRSPASEPRYGRVLDGQGGEPHGEPREPILRVRPALQGRRGEALRRGGADQGPEAFREAGDVLRLPGRGAAGRAGGLVEL